MLFKSISIIGMVILSLTSDVRGNDDRHNSNSWNLSQAVSNVVPYAVGGVAIVGSVYGAYLGATFASETLQIPVKSMLSWGFARSWQGGLAGLVVTSIPVSMKLMSLSGLTRLVSQDHDAAWAVEEMRRRATSIALVYLALGTFLGAALGGVGGGVEGLIRHYIGA